MFSYVLVAGFLATAISPAPQQAATAVTTSENRQVYDSKFFGQFNPQTARDMIDRIPGFVLNLGDALRGFGSTAGNILIDGARPLSKSGGIESALERLPAHSVARIEIVRGTSGNNETGDQSVFANIILKRQASSGFWQWSLTRNANGQLSSAANASYTTELGPWKVSGRILASLNRYPYSAGGSRISRDENGVLTNNHLEEIPLNAENFIFYADAGRPLWGGSLKLTSRFSSRPLERITERQGFGTRAPVGSPDDLTQIELNRSLKDGELGIEWATPPGKGWAFKLLSLLSYRDFDLQQDTGTERPIGTLASSSLFNRAQEELESVLRMTALRKSERVTYEMGGELAYNRLDSNLQLHRTTPEGTSTITLPAANVTVSEYRGEAFAKMTWRLADALTAETGATVEYSRIGVAGDASSSQTFTYVKPTVALSYDLRPDLQLRLKARRSVGQLDFSDFAASASAADDRLTAGNPELGPDQTTGLSFAVDYRSENKLALNAETFFEWRDNILEEIILPSGGFGIGNAGSGKFWGLRANASIPLSFVLPGGLLQVETEFVDSSFNDPVTHSVRQISGTDSPLITVDFRQDIAEANWSWGVSYSAPFDGTFYFVGEESTSRDSANWSAFIETTRFLGAKINLRYAAIGGQRFLRERRFFSPHRGGGFGGTQEIDSRINASLMLTVSKQF